MFLILIFLFSNNLIPKDEENWQIKMEEGKSLKEVLEDAFSFYDAKIKEDPSSFIFRSALLKTIYYKGCYTGMGNEEAKVLFSYGKKIGEEGKELLKKLLKMEKLEDPEEVARRCKDIKGIAEFFFWDAACWGQWALLYGKIKAAKEGAAKKIFISAEISRILDEKLEDGGPHRILGRLHHQTPKIPFITGWVSKEKALEHLKKAIELGPEEIMNYLFLGELYLDLGEKEKAKEIFEMGLQLKVRKEKEPGDLDSLKKIKENLKNLK